VLCASLCAFEEKTYVELTVVVSSGCGQSPELEQC
jgi:hypothetical protein